MSYVDLTNLVPVEEQLQGYLVSMENINLSEGETPRSWLHAMSLGTYEHALYGKLKFTADRIKRFADNINNKVRGVEIAIDYAHKNDEEAAGWIKMAEARPNGLWVLVEWTAAAAEKIHNKEFRYFSAEFVPQWKDPKSGKVFQDVVFGGGLTNRPFLKDLLPVNLSEVFGEQKEKDRMDLDKLRKALKLSENATEEEILTAAAELSEATEPPEEEEEEEVTTPPVTDELAKLSEEHPVIKTLVDQVAILQTTTRLSEIDNKVTKMSTAGKYAIPPAVTEELKKLWVSLPQQFDEKFSELFSQLTKTGLVKLAEEGSSSTDDRGGKTATEVFQSTVKKLMDSEEGMSYADATVKASMDNPELFEEYRREATQGVQL